VKSWDVYGSPVTLHYEGKPKFKTLPGGMISMFLATLIQIYTIVMGKQMLFRERWSLVQ
jgi:hypothetical protein